MKKTLILSSFIFTSLVFGQNQSSIKTEENIKKSEITISVPKEIQIKNTSSSKENPLEKNMPWIIALTIGILSAGVNFWVAHRLRQSNERNLQRQIESAQNTTLTQFKATIATKNRQDWINELRNDLSELLTYSIQYNRGNNDEDEQRYLEKIIFSKSKIELLINHDKKEQIQLLDDIEELLRLIIEDREVPVEEYQAVRSKIIASARTIFNVHWKKIKELK